MKNLIKKLFNLAKDNYILRILILLPFYFGRFTYYAFKNKSLMFYRYYPGYHGSTIPSMRYVQDYYKKISDSGINQVDGLDLNETKQEELLKLFSNYYKDFNPSENQSDDKLYYYNNDMFVFNDAFPLYCMFRHFKPNVVIEVGSGFSSALMLDITAEILPDTVLTFIDPYSQTITEVLDRNPNGKYKLIRKEVQDIQLDAFSILQENDILFIDTSHVVKIGSDLSKLFFSIIPSLNKGVIIHIHDIWYPWVYPETLIKEGCTYNETYFVRSFLQYNTSFEILFFNSMLECQNKEFISANMPGYFKSSGKSLWLRKIV